jgi:hypothetical protein
MTRLAMLALVAMLATLISHTPADARRIKVGVYSQNVTRHKAAVGASIHTSEHTPATPDRPATEPAATPEGAPAAPAVPALNSTAPILRKAHPAGPGSRWYTTVGGQRCIFLPGSVTPCFTVVPGGGARRPPPRIDPAVIAASLARRLSLGPGRIEASPSSRVDGLTGVASWFWLDPAPAVQTLSISLGGEHVTVTASVTGVRWAFGDGSLVAGGPGIPYRPGPPPPDAVRHAYETRCLPGDQGHDPYVLSSCGTRGYTVAAELAWGISYDASGPVSESGDLPSRTTGTSLDYPVSEARGFLTAGGGT